MELWKGVTADLGIGRDIKLRIWIHWSRIIVVEGRIGRRGKNREWRESGGIVVNIIGVAARVIERRDTIGTRFESRKAS